MGLYPYQANYPNMDLYRRRSLSPNDLYNSRLQTSNDQNIYSSNQNTLTPNSLYNYQPQASGAGVQGGNMTGEQGGTGMDYGSWAQMIASAIQVMQNNKKQFPGGSISPMSVGTKPLFQPQVFPLRMAQPQPQQQQLPGFLAQLLSMRR